MICVSWAAAEAVVGYDRSAVLREALREVFAQSLGVVAPNVIENRSLLFLQFLRGEIADQTSLVGIDEADPEHERTDLALFVHRHERIRRQRADLGNTRAVHERGRGDVRAAGRGAEDRNDLVMVDEPPDRVHGVFGPRLVIVDDDFELLAQNAALRIDLFRRKLDRIDFGLAVRSEISGDSGEIPDLDGLFRPRARNDTETQHREEQNRLSQNTHLRDVCRSPETPSSAASDPI